MDNDSNKNNNKPEAGSWRRPERYKLGAFGARWDDPISQNWRSAGPQGAGPRASYVPASYVPAPPLGPRPSSNARGTGANVWRGGGGPRPAFDFTDVRASLERGKPGPASRGRKRSAGEDGDDDDDKHQQHKRIRVVHDPDLETAEAQRARALMILTDEIAEATWRDAGGETFRGAVDGGVAAALRPDSYVVVVGGGDGAGRGIGGAAGVEVVQERVWANRNAGNLMDKLGERIEGLREQVDLVRRRAVSCDREVRKLVQEGKRQKLDLGEDDGGKDDGQDEETEKEAGKGVETEEGTEKGTERGTEKGAETEETEKDKGKEKRRGKGKEPWRHKVKGKGKDNIVPKEETMQERMLNQFRDVRFRTMIQQARNRGHMNMNASFSAWGGATQLYSRLKLLSSVIHGGDLRSDIALIDSDYLETRHGEGLRRFYLEMFQKIYMISLDLARFLVQAERKHFLASTWINLIDRYCYVADSTMQEHQDKRVKRGNKGPDENNDQVQVIFKTDKEYRKWITELEELMTKTTADKPLAALTAADLKKADEHAQKLWKEGESVVLWNKLKVDHLWGPSARFQIEHNSPYFRQKFRPATDD